MPKQYEIIGKKIEDMPQSVSYESTNGRDVTGEPFSTVTKGDSSVSVDPIVINKNSGFAKAVNKIILFDLELSDVEFWFVVEHRYLRVGTDYATGKSFAYRQKGSWVPGDYAKGNQSLDLAGTIQWTGTKEYGTFDKSLTKDNFVASSSIPDDSAMFYKDGDASRSEFRLYYETDVTA